VIPHDQTGTTRAHIQPVAVPNLIDENDVHKGPCTECRSVKDPTKHDGDGQGEVVMPLPPQHDKYSTKDSVQVKQAE
jgi:hypothetical protein